MENDDLALSPQWRVVGGNFQTSVEYLVVTTVVSSSARGDFDSVGYKEASRLFHHPLDPCLSYFALTMYHNGLLDSSGRWGHARQIDECHVTNN